jgi:hypothetical protein
MNSCTSAQSRASAKNWQDPQRVLRSEASGSDPSLRYFEHPTWGLRQRGVLVLWGLL